MWVLTHTVIVEPLKIQTTFNSSAQISGALSNRKFSAAETMTLGVVPAFGAAPLIALTGMISSRCRRT
jgi:hypothetical protein